MEEQKVAEVKPHRVGYTTGFGTEPACPAAQFRHLIHQRIYVSTDFHCDGDGGLQLPVMVGQQAGQGTVG